MPNDAIRSADASTSALDISGAASVLSGGVLSGAAELPAYFTIDESALAAVAVEGGLVIRSDAAGAEVPGYIASGAATSGDRIPSGGGDYAGPLGASLAGAAGAGALLPDPVISGSAWLDPALEAGRALIAAPGVVVSGMIVLSDGGADLTPQASEVAAAEGAAAGVPSGAILGAGVVSSLEVTGGVTLESDALLAASGVKVESGGELQS